MNNKIRLQKIIADSGYCSRRRAEAYIKEGRVKVNGRTVQIGDKASERGDIITVNGERIASKAKPRYIKLYKPRGYLCSASDPHVGTKRLVTELLNKIPERVYPVGRLDVNSEGLILLTNDGGFANRIAHPSSAVSKIYRVTVAGKADELKAEKLASGVDIGEGEITRPCSVQIITEEEKRTVMLFAISEGKNRQIRRMCEAVGLDVSRLKRVSVGGVKLGVLKPGEYADLTKQELRLLEVTCGRNKESSESRRNRKI
ncbi:MAG: rRNA pseudouridine synthase [Oscillospiraceae bacterium]|nr:rRNA pseudouridine synthase [Oscillospiraceae bacterium]